MEGLIKGILDVAFGDHDDNNSNRRGETESNDRDREERSRSSWAQVVSGDQDDDADRPIHHSNQGYARNQNEESRFGRNEETESAGYQHSRRPQKAAYQGYERAEDTRQDGYSQSYQNQNQNQNQKEGEGSNDGWETVGKKPPRRHQPVQKDNWSNFKRPADEQDYSSDVNYSSNMEPSDEELADLSRACNKLWELDLNRLTPGTDYQIDCGEGKKVYQNQDMAESTLFSSLSKEALKRPTFSRFCSLLDNYNPHEGYKEEVTSQEKQEQAAFIEEISRTAPIKYLHKYLLAKGIVSESYQDFKRVMTSIWFDLYGRGGTSGCSSAFEHVFVGEIKQRGEESVSGFHNWLQFYLEEAKGRVDYQGYIFPRRRGQVPDSETQLLTIQFEWNGVLKSVSSTLVGVSPEFEVALYTLCFYMGGEDNYVELGPYPVNIKCYRLGNKIGSVFPIADS